MDTGQQGHLDVCSCPYLVTAPAVATVLSDYTAVLIIRYCGILFRCTVGIFLSPSLPITSLFEIAWTLATLYHARCRLSSVRKMVGSSMWILMMLVGTEAARVRCRGPSCRRGHRRMPLSTANSAGLRDRASPHGCRALAHAPAGRRFLVVELEQGLTNQRPRIALSRSTTSGRETITIAAGQVRRVPVPRRSHSRRSST